MTKRNIEPQKKGGGEADIGRIFTDTRHINIISCWQPTMRGPPTLKLHRLQLPI